MPASQHARVAAGFAAAACAAANPASDAATALSTSGLGDDSAIAISGPRGFGLAMAASGPGDGMSFGAGPLRQLVEGVRRGPCPHLRALLSALLWPSYECREYGGDGCALPSPAQASSCELHDAKRPQGPDELASHPLPPLSASCHNHRWLARILAISAGRNAVAEIQFEHERAEDGAQYEADVPLKYLRRAPADIPVFVMPWMAPPPPQLAALIEACEPAALKRLLLEHTRSQQAVSPELLQQAAASAASDASSLSSSSSSSSERPTTFMEKVEYLRKSLGITGASPTAQSVIREANEMMDLETQGTLPDQLDRLMRKFFEAPGP